MTEPRIDQRYGIGGPLLRVVVLAVLAVSLLALSPVEVAGAQVDVTAPVVVSGPTITSSPANGQIYGAGESVTFSVTFSEPVTVTGEPRLRFVMGDKQRRARFARVAANGTTVVYSYKVVARAGDVDVDGISVKASQLRMAHGMIVDADDNAADLTHDALADQPGHKVDGAAPVVVSGPTVTTSPANGDTYGKGESVRFAVTFSEPVTVTGEPRLRFMMGDKQRRSRFSHVAADGATLVYSYAVRANDADVDGISVKASQLRMAHGMIVDGAGNAADLTHDALADQPGHKVNGGGDKADPLSTPTNLTAAVNVKSASVTWDAATGGKRDGSLSYRLEYKLAAQKWDAATTRSTTDRSVLLENLSPGNYEVRLLATDSAGQSPYTPAISFKVHPPPPTPSNVAVSVTGAKTVVSWDEPDTTSGIDRYRVQWRWVNQEFDDARSATVLPTTAKSGKFSYDLSGRVYRVRVVAEGPGGMTASGAVLVRTNENIVYDMIERTVVAHYRDSHGWIKETWAYITDPSFSISVTDTAPFMWVPTVISGQPLNRGVARSIGTNTAWTSDYYANGYVHEMAHVWTLSDGAAAKPAPIGVAMLYFERRARAAAEKTGNKGCKAEELLADALMALTPAISSSVLTVDLGGGILGHIIGSPVATAYWGGDCTDGLDKPDQAALDVVAAASRGEMPAWLRDANDDGNGNLDLTLLWEDVTKFGNHRSDYSSEGWGYKAIAAYHLRDAFGGYCSVHQARASFEGRTKGITNPWRDGGCTPGAPTGVRAAPGDGSLAVSWTAPAQTGVSAVTSYIVQYKASNESYSTQRQVTVTGDTTSATISGLRNGETYTVRVIAVNLLDDHNGSTTNDGWSTPSPEASASPVAG